ncbi:MAG: hypothetical protein JNL19_09135 [Burkholderiales bacterium]|nr:hypothetical protein [Burkholderiales bacterium]
MLINDEKRIDQQSEQDIWAAWRTRPAKSGRFRIVAPGSRRSSRFRGDPGTLWGEALISERNRFFKRQLAFWHVAVQKASVGLVIC